MVNNIRNNTISEITAKEGINVLNKIKNTEIIKKRRYAPKQKELLNLFNDLLDTTLFNKTQNQKVKKTKMKVEMKM